MRRAVGLFAASVVVTCLVHGCAGGAPESARSVTKAPEANSAGTQPSDRGETACALLDALLLKDGAQHGDWAVPLSHRCRINWETAAPVSDLGGWRRNGKVPISYFTSMDATALDSMYWTIILTGQQSSGYDQVIITTDALERLECDPLFAAMLRCTGVVSDTLMNEDETLTFVQRTYRFQRPGFKGAWVSQCLSMGTEMGDCSIAFRWQEKALPNDPCF